MAYLVPIATNTTGVKTFRAVWSIFDTFFVFDLDLEFRKINCDTNDMIESNLARKCNQNLRQVVRATSTWAKSTYFGPIPGQLSRILSVRGHLVESRNLDLQAVLLTSASFNIDYSNNSAVALHTNSLLNLAYSIDSPCGIML